MGNPLLTILIIQTLAICVAFNHVVFHPLDAMFLNVFDGLKNYYTLYQYVVQEPSDMGMWHFTALNYPFGEYVFFTDNTPALALPLRFIHLYITDISDYIIPAHNFFFLFFQLILPVFVFKLIRPANKNLILLIILLSLGITWVNPQVLKITYGVSNLSVALFSVFVVFLLRDINNIRAAYSSGKILKLCLKSFALILISGFFHLYYLVILSMPLLIFLAYTGIRSLKDREWKSLMIYGCISLSIILGALSMKLLISSVDTYSELRRAGAQGFGYEGWRLIPEALITPYPFNRITPFLQSCAYDKVNSESVGFIGNFNFYNSIICLLFATTFILMKRSGARDLYKKVIKNRLLLGMAITTFFVFFTACGPYVQFCFIPLSFDNWFSLFYFLYTKIELVTQFRCLGRFIWPAFWIIFYVNIVMFYKWYGVLKNHNITFANLLAGVLAIFMFVDTIDFIKYHNSTRLENTYKKENLALLFHKIKDWDFTKYQAIYTIPIVNSGSENYDITTNDRVDWTVYWTRLSIFTKLPLFNCIISRTAENQAQAQFDIISKKQVPKLILDKLNSKKVLVIYWPEYEKNYDVQIVDAARHVATGGSKIITEFKMDSITTIDGIQYFEWDIKASNKSHKISH